MLRDSHPRPGSSPSHKSLTITVWISGPSIQHHCFFSLRGLIYSGSCNLLSREDLSLSPHSGKLIKGGQLGPEVPHLPGVG